VLYGLTGDQLCRRLDHLLVVPEDDRVSEPERLRTGPARLSAPETARSLDRFSAVQELGVGALDVSVVPAGRLASHSARSFRRAR
jgi:hypothetical protein